MLAAFAQALMSAQASMQCGAGLGERCDERVNSRNGYRHRPWDTRVGTIDLAVPKLRAGLYSPEFLLVPRRQAEQALVAVVCQAYVEGVSTRRVDDLVKAMGIEGISKSEVSRMAAELDVKVAEFRNRPLDAGPYRYLWIDAVTQKVREGGRVVNVSAVIATAANAEGRREIVGLDIVTTEDTAAWTEFLRSLVARGLAGVELVISDAHGGIKAAIATVLAEATWQRCRTHFMANLASRVPKASWPMIATLVRSVFEQPDRDTTWSQLGDVIDKLTTTGFVDAAVFVLDAADDILAFSAFPRRALAENPVEQPPGAVEQRDPPAHRRGRDLPPPPSGDPPGRGGPGRTDRRVDHRQALHECRVTQGTSGHNHISGRSPAGHRSRHGDRRWMTIAVVPPKRRSVVAIANRRRPYAQAYTTITSACICSLQLSATLI